MENNDILFELGLDVFNFYHNLFIFLICFPFFIIFIIFFYYICKKIYKRYYTILRPIVLFLYDAKSLFYILYFFIRKNVLLPVLNIFTVTFFSIDIIYLIESNNISKERIISEVEIYTRLQFTLPHRDNTVVNEYIKSKYKPNLEIKEKIIDEKEEQEEKEEIIIELPKINWKYKNTDIWPPKS